MECSICIISIMKAILLPYDRALLFITLLSSYHFSNFLEITKCNTEIKKIEIFTVHFNFIQLVKFNSD